MNNFLQLVLVLTLGALCTQSSHAQLLGEDLPANAQGIKVIDKVGEFLPLDAVFTDEAGNRVTLGSYFDDGKPVVLTLNYSDCPGLCIAQLNNFTMMLREIHAAGLGDDYRILTISIDPTEPFGKAARTKEKYFGLLPDSVPEGAWHFLTGDTENVLRIAKSVGFVYTYDKVSKQYNHPAVTYFISPSGRICRYLLELGVEPKQFKLAVGEAREGILSANLSEVLVQMCFYYDPDANRYTASARRILALGGGAFCVVLLGCTAPFWFSRRMAQAKQKQPAGEVKPAPEDKQLQLWGGAHATDSPGAS